MLLDIFKGNLIYWHWFSIYLEFSIMYLHYFENKREYIKFEEFLALVCIDLKMSVFCLYNCLYIRVNRLQMQDQGMSSPPGCMHLG